MPSNPDPTGMGPLTTPSGMLNELAREVDAMQRQLEAIKQKLKGAAQTESPDKPQDQK